MRWRTRWWCSPRSLGAARTNRRPVSPAGVKGGMVHGASDKHAAYPARDPVTPEDIAATIYYALGVDASTEFVDRLGRPHAVAMGEPILEIFG